MADAVYCEYWPWAPLDKRYRITLLLNEQLIPALQHPGLPVYHMLPRLSYRVEANPDAPDDTNTGAYDEFAAQQSAGTRGLQHLHLRGRIIATGFQHTARMDEWVFAPFFAQLRAHPHFRRAMSWWSSPHCLFDIYRAWRQEVSLQENIVYQLLPPVDAILRFMPHELLVVREFSPIIPTTWTPLGRSDIYGLLRHAQLPKAVATHHCLFVMEVKPRVNHEAMANRLVNAGMPLMGSNPSKYERMRVGGTNQMTEQMASSNAPIGLIYNGSSPVVYERDFDHDRRERLQAVAYNASIQGVPGNRRPQRPRPTVELRSWTIGFGHPGDPFQPYNVYFRVYNPALVFSAIAHYAYCKILERNRLYPELAISAFALLGYC